MKPKPFRIFRAGTHTDSAGQATTFTAEALKATVKAYNEGEWRAPLVAGHPKGNAPAYGWVGQMRIDDNADVWVDTVDQLNPDFGELMQNGAFRNRSASWYAPDHPNNPTPGVWQLRHLGVLGAQPPALKGLGDVEFGDADGITVEFGDYTTSTVAGILRRLRDSLIAKWGVEEADKAVPGFLVEDLEADGRRQIDSATDPSFSEPEADTMTPEQIAALQAKADRADALAAQNAELTTANTGLQTQVQSFSESQRTAQRAVALVDAKAALQPLVTAGTLLPAQLDNAAEFMVGLDNETATFEFGEATGEKKLTARGFFTALLAAAPKQVEYAEHTGNVSLPSDMKPEDLAQKAREYQDAMAGKGVTVTSAQSVDAVLAGRSA